MIFFLVVAVEMFGFLETGRERCFVVFAGKERWDLNFLGFFRSFKNFLVFTRVRFCFWVVYLF